VLVLKQVKFLNLSSFPPVSSRSIKKELNKSKFYNKNKSSSNCSDKKKEHTYIQTLSGNVKEILKIKENFPQLSFKKIKDIYKMINEIGRPKSCINIITKNLLCKQIIISMDNKNISKFIVFSSEHITNLNCTLKNIKSDIFINFIYTNHHSLIVISNKVVRVENSKLSFYCWIFILFYFILFFI